MRWPSRVPALMRNSTVSVRVTVPSPWQVAQAFEMRPVPLQLGQVMLNFIRPPICVTWPVPLHSGHCRAAGMRLAMAGGAKSPGG